MVLKVIVKILVCDHLILTVRRATRGLADSINEPLGTFVTNILSLVVYRSPTRPETCSRTCMHYRREDKCTQHHRDIAPCCDSTGAIDPIDFGYIEWQIGTSRKCLERMTRRIDSRWLTPGKKQMAFISSSYRSPTSHLNFSSSN